MQLLLIEHFCLRYREGNRSSQSIVSNFAPKATVKSKGKSKLTDGLLGINVFV